MCACPRAHCLSEFEIDAIIFTSFFFAFPTKLCSLSFFAAGKKKTNATKKRAHTERTNANDESRTRAVAARR